MYSLKTKYRDHVFHMIDIFFLGLFLLNSKVTEKKKLGELLVSKSVAFDSKWLLKS